MCLMPILSAAIRTASFQISGKGSGGLDEIMAGDIRNSGCETVQFQWFLKEELVKASARAGLYLPVEEVPQTADKTLRIQTMQPDIKNKYIKFNRRHKRLLEQLVQFPMGAR